jgi:hypothetical protein
MSYILVVNPFILSKAGEYPSSSSSSSSLSLSLSLSDRPRMISNQHGIDCCDLLWIVLQVVPPIHFHFVVSQWQPRSHQRFLQHGLAYLQTCLSVLLQVSIDRNIQVNQTSSIKNAAVISIIVIHHFTIDDGAGMGLNSYFAYGVCLKLGLSWRIALVHTHRYQHHHHHHRILMLTLVSISTWLADAFISFHACRLHASSKVYCLSSSHYQASARTFSSMHLIASRNQS